MPPVVKIQRSRSGADCAIVALAMYLERPYEDILAAAVRVTRSADVHRTRGLYTREMRRVATALGVELSLRRGFDLDADEGVIGFTHASADGHVALLKGGLIFDHDATCWEPEVFCVHYGYRPVSLLVKVNE